MKKPKISDYRRLTAEDLQGLLHLRRRGGAIKPKKGKGAPYDRNKAKRGEYD